MKQSTSNSMLNRVPCPLSYTSCVYKKIYFTVPVCCKPLAFRLRDKWSRLLSRLPFGLDSVLAPLPFSFCQLSTVRSFSLKGSGGYGASSSLLTGFPSYVVQSQYWLKDKRPTCGPT
ncbi:hypothetical protein ILYODFUR_013843 [Ilyodon furcidens]|uniref:Uncharacterized protein n=1 Tax=Ilyodon furcidens TaxID=33524 RepID=A0ABV0TUE5_9TELE